MAESRSPNTLSDADEERLDAFESAWQSGPVPRIADYLSSKPDSAWVFAILSIDLEYRWKRYPDSAGPNDSDSLPTFPKLEDYATACPGRSDAILTPRMIAEEYRVRMRWGDRPTRQEYYSRFSHLQTVVESRLDQIESEIQLESDATELSVQSSQSFGLGTTVSQPDKQPEDSGFEISQNDCPRIGKYQAIRLLGKGGFGEVWLADHPNLEAKKVAIKIPRRDRTFAASTLDSFRREGNKHAALDDIPGVVKVLDADEVEGLPHIVSEFIDGENLSSRLKRGALPCEEAITLVAKVATILHLAHRKGFVHRDVKPENILLDSQGQPHLADFGLAASELEIVQEGPSVVGTYAYMSPEQARGQSHLADGRADIYSLGVVLYECLSGRLPFQANNWREYRDQLLHKDPRPLRMVDDQLPRIYEAICERCLKKSPTDRYATARDLYLHLQSAVGHPKRRHLLMVGGVLLAVLILGVAGHLFYDRGTESEKTDGLETSTDSSNSSENSHVREFATRTARRHVKQELPLSQTSILLQEERKPPCKIRHDANNKQLEIESSTHTLVRFGTAKARCYRLQLHFVPVGQGDTQFACGLFFGFHNSAADDYRYQCVSISASRDVYTTYRSIIAAAIPRDVNPSLVMSNFGGSNPFPKEDQYVLDILVGDTGLQKVLINNRPIDNATTIEANGRTTDHDYEGQFGVVVESGAIVVKKLVLQIVEE